MKNLLFAVAFLLAGPALAQDGAPKVHARLVTQDTAIAPGGTITVALEEQIAPGWHTYWKNPGDAGAPTEIQWTLPAGWKADGVQWPRPMRVPVGPLMDYGYEGKLWLLTKITAPSDAKGPVTIRAAVSWLVCKNVCIPEDTALILTLPVGAAKPDAVVAHDFAAAHALLPARAPWKINYALGNTLDLYVAAPALAAAHPARVDFFPGRTGLIKNAAPQRIGYSKDGLVLRLAPGNKVNGLLEGVLVLTSRDGSVQALEVAAAPGPVPAADFAAAPSASSDDLSLGLAILFAFLGGLILNVMPCVLPILAMKALSLAGHGGTGRSESFSYAAGAIVSFAVLGLAILLLRQAGSAVGWGFQLQSPIAVAGFALLVFAVGLNLSGLFEVGSITAGESLTRKSGVTGAFFTGVLAVAVAAPCTAPFMAGALGYALTQSVAMAMAVFIALGIGFALPFLLLGLWPRALSFMPRPGTWMLQLKQFLAFPMYAAAAWLVWVLARETGANGVAIILAAMVAVALAAWLWSVTRASTPRGRGVGAVVALAVLGAALYAVSLLTTQASASAQSAKGEAFSAAKLASYRAAGRPVFVDATAAWCITCLVNEDAVLSRDSVRSAFAAHNVVMMVADWTNQNPQITALLKENGRSGVPMYAYYAPNAAKAEILPQILTEAGLLQTLGNS